MLPTGAAAEVELSECRICADHEQIIAFVDPLVPRPGGQDRDVTRLELEYPTSGSTEAHSDMAASDPKHLMNLGAIVDVIIDAVPPGLLPTIALEQDLKQSCGMHSQCGWARDIGSAAICYCLEQGHHRRIERHSASVSAVLSDLLSTFSLMTSMRGMGNVLEVPLSFNASP
jgi:hypothetical protein